MVFSPGTLAALGLCSYFCSDPLNLSNMSGSSQDLPAKGAGKDLGLVLKVSRKQKPPQDHQTRKCQRNLPGCLRTDHWRRMKADAVYDWTPDVSSRAGTMAEKEDVRDGKQKINYVYTCVHCVARDKEMSIVDARRFIKQKPTEKKIARVEAWVHARTYVQRTFHFLGVVPDDDAKSDSGVSVDSTMAPDDDDGVSVASDLSTAASMTSTLPDFNSNRQRKKAMRKKAAMEFNSMKQLFGPVLWILKLKSEDMDEAVEAAKKFQIWMNGKPADDDDEADAACGDKLEILLEDAVYKERSFATKENPVAMRLAADYSDQWFKHCKGEFNVYYVCMAGGSANLCCTLIESMAWDRFKDQLEATGQRWYCKVCGAKYMTRFGVLCEIVTGGKALYCRAELPPHDMQDAKCMMIEQRFHAAQTPQELLDSLPKVSPMERGYFFHEAPGLAGHYRCNSLIFLDLPKLDWNQLYNLARK